jgi:hypothetical protein
VNVDLAIADIVAIRADAEENQQKREHNGGVADVLALVKADLVQERNGEDHHQRGKSAGNESEN